MDKLLQEVKMTLRINTDVFNNQIKRLIRACILDLGVAGVSTDEIGTDYLDNDLIVQAVSTYVKMHFGEVEDGVYKRLKESYDEQKAQMSNATGYTVWTDQESAS